MMMMMMMLKFGETVLIQTIQFSVNTVSMSKTVPFQTIQFGIQKRLRRKLFGLA